MTGSSSPHPSSDSSIFATVTNAVGNDVFLSYSRKDKAFVEILDAAFRQMGRDPWVDWDDIHKGEEWWKAIQQGIEAADTFIFVISPDSAASPVCWDEIEHAARCNKRFLPIVRREGFDPKQLHPAISSHNWLFFRETDDFDRAFQKLLRAMDLDLSYVHLHTRWLVRALEWQTKGQNPSYLLRGVDLQDARQWLAQGISKTPHPTERHTLYINASIDAEVASLKARQRAKWVVLLSTVLINMLLSIATGLWFYRFMTDRTLQQVHTNLTNALNVGLVGIDGDDFVALARLNVPTGSTPIDNPLYQAHQTWLYRVHTVFPRATLRTYIRGSQPNEILWIGDMSRTLNANHTDFREAYAVKHGEIQVYDGETNQTPITPPYADVSGRWISTTAPIRNSTGRVVGGLKVYFGENYVMEVQRKVREGLLIAYLLIFSWLLLLSLIILRVTRPLEQVKADRA